MKWQGIYSGPDRDKLLEIAALARAAHAAGNQEESQRLCRKHDDLALAVLRRRNEERGQ